MLNYMSNSYSKCVTKLQPLFNMIIDKNNKPKMEPCEQYHLDIAEDALKKGHPEEAKALILMYNDTSERANHLLQQLSEIDSDVAMEDDSELEFAMPPACVTIDPEKQMLTLTIVMRVRLLRLEGRQAYTNRALNDVEMFEVTKLPRFYDHMADIVDELMKTIFAFDADNFYDANTYLGKAEALFLELCPERLRKYTKKSEKTVNNDNILKDVKPVGYQPLPRDELTVKGNWEDVKKLVEKASKFMVEQNYVKAKRLAEKAERIYQTPAAKALLEQIRIVTEAREEAAERAKEKAIKEAAQKAIDEEIAVKAAAEKAARDAAKKAVEKDKREAAQKDAEKAKREAAENAKKEAQKDVKKAKNEAAQKDIKNHQNSNIHIEIGQEAVGGFENARSPSGAESLKRNADPEQPSPDAGKKRRADGLTSVAQEAFSKGDIATAEKLAKKASKLNPSGETDKLLEKIHNRISQSNAEKKENANPNAMKNTSENQSDSDVQSEKITTLLNKVKECLALGRLDDAERALRDVRDCGPRTTEDVKHWEAQLRAARASRSSTENAQMSYPVVRHSNPDGRNSPEEKSSEPKNRAQINAKNFLGIARNALAARDYEKAEKFLKKSNAACPCDATEQLLQDVQIEMFSKDAHNSNVKKTCETSSNNNKHSLIENIEKAESLYSQAKKTLSQKNFKEAMDLAVESQKFNKLVKVETLKKEIIKARNNFKSSEKNIECNTNKGRDVTVVDKAVGLVMQAKAEMGNKNMKKAEQLVVQSIEIHSTESAKELLMTVHQYQPKHEQSPDINYGPSTNHDEAQKCIKVAETAAKDKDFKRAEHFLEKALRMSPSTEAKEMLESVRVNLRNSGNAHANPDTQQQPNVGTSTREDQNYKTNHEDLKHDVEKCIEVAMNAISAEDYDKATKFLKKAQRIQPSEKALELLEDVQEGIKQQKMRMANEEKAAPFVSLAMTAIDREQYEFAEILLVNAWIKHKSGTAEKLIKQVREIVAQANSENAGKGTKKNKDSTLLLDEQRRISEELISYARDMMTKKHLESAECVLMIAQNTYPTKPAGEMLTGVRYQIDFDTSGEHRRLNTKDWKFTKISQEGNKNRDAFKCNNYVQMAQRAYETGDFNAAKEFLLEAENLFLHKNIKKLIKQVEEAKNPDSSYKK